MGCFWWVTSCGGLLVVWRISDLGTLLGLPLLVGCSASYGGLLVVGYILWWAASHGGLLVCSVEEA